MVQVQQAGAHNEDETKEQYLADMGNRTDGPGFAIPLEPGSGVRRILPLVIDPKEPMESLNHRFEEARQGWRWTDLYYRYMPRDEAPRLRANRNELIFTMVEIQMAQQGFRVPEERICGGRSGATLGRHF